MLHKTVILVINSDQPTKFIGQHSIFEIRNGHVHQSLSLNQSLSRNEDTDSAIKVEKDEMKSMPQQIPIVNISKRTESVGEDDIEPFSWVPPPPAIPDSFNNDEIAASVRFNIIFEFGIFKFGIFKFGIFEFGIFEFGIFDFGVYEFGIFEFGIFDDEISASVFCII